MYVKKKPNDIPKVDNILKYIKYTPIFFFGIKSNKYFLFTVVFKPKPKRNLDKHKQNILLGAKIVNKVPIIDKRQDINIGVLYVLYKIYFKYIIDNKPPKGVIPIINKYMFFSIFAFVGYFWDTNVKTIGKKYE